MKQIFVNQQYNLNRIGDALSWCALANDEKKKASGRWSLVADVGANIGFSVLYFIDHLPSAHIMAIEPDLENFKLLSKNVDGLDVETIRRAASSTKGKTRVVDPGRGR
jgi:hypothetical protein